ncbi:probable pectinesterase/pectinesterase inhibitor 59 [Cornus florida]|uniref:probable pectinesterase/pectinesterase inhibitor 59 n=1 Tax=Cornus florida TaxID=4283 RepID=UPI002897C10C|nr:probable pectinesterase/pectinesterase inhibitor 59 [Cornus florida]
MATKLFGVLFLIISFSSFFSQVLSDDDQSESGDISRWCSTTPHPEPCKYFMNHSHHNFEIPKCRADFRTMAVQVAMDRAYHAQSLAKQLGPHCRSKRKKAAWRDCCDLFDDAILSLNRTLQGLRNNGSRSDFDAQTWLSAALTSLETCRAGSHELNVSSFISPIISNNVSELISNSLAINGVLMQDQSYKEGFPSWVSKGDRKLLQSKSLSSRANVVVAKDGSGNFGTIQAAINAAAKKTGNGRFIIHLKRGVYTENILIGRNLNNIIFVGDGLRYTIITGSRSSTGGFTTYSTATFGVDGIGFMARGITFRNTAGPQNGQAVAFRSASDLSVFYACAFDGYQDTLFVHAQRQFYKSCYIYGTIDFIFGNAAVVFQNCVIYVRKPLSGQANTITAQGRGDPYQNTGISIHNSRVLAAPDLRPVVSSFKTYLGRPWQQYSRTVFLKTYLDSLVSPEGWSTWDASNFALDTLYYGEYMNFGPASSTTNRVKWRGYRVITNAKEALQFTVGSFIAGRSWLPSTGVPFIAGL